MTRATPGQNILASDVNSLAEQVRAARHFGATASFEVHQGKYGTVLAAAETSVIETIKITGYLSDGSPLPNGAPVERSNEGIFRGIVQRFDTAQYFDSSAGSYDNTDLTTAPYFDGEDCHVVDLDVWNGTVSAKAPLVIGERVLGVRLGAKYSFMPWDNIVRALPLFAILNRDRRGVPFKNVDTATIPAFGVIKFTNSVPFIGPSNYAPYYVQAKKPDATLSVAGANAGNFCYGVNAGVDVPAGQFGVCRLEGVATTFVDTYTLAPGMICGPQPDSFSARIGYPGFRYLQPLTWAGGNLARVVIESAPSFVGKTVSTINSNSTTGLFASSAVKVYAFNGGAFVDAGFNAIDVINFGAMILSDKWVRCQLMSGYWVVEKIDA